jgi:glycosyltransferase involved in cell wall biosynthesis
MPYPRVDPHLALPNSNGFYESLGVDVIHFPYQVFVQSQVPFIYNPHDLQHLHYPHFFSHEEFAWREYTYRVGCQNACAIATPSQWVKDDVVIQYKIAPQNVFAIRYGPTTEWYDPVDNDVLYRVQHKFRLPFPFVLYPAQTWEHKNHIRLLEAIALLRDREHLLVKLVCTGRKNAFWPVIEKRLNSLGLNDRVRFLGYVSPTDLRALYHLAQCVICPSLFEGGGLTILEAFHENVPVACSNITSLPEYAGDAALVFDPFNVKSVADALQRLVTDADLRETLRARGGARARFFNWELTAKTYRALYRMVANRPLSQADRDLIERGRR